MEAFKYTVVLERDEEGGYTVTVPALPGCVTQGDTIAESLANAKEAIEVYLESLALDGKPFPPDVKEANIQLEETEEVLIFKLWVEPGIDKKSNLRALNIAMMNFMNVMLNTWNVIERAILSPLVWMGNCSLTPTGFVSCVKRQKSSGRAISPSARLGILTY